jgi:hypothetical protein
MAPVGARANFQSVPKFHVTLPNQTSIFFPPKLSKFCWNALLQLPRFNKIQNSVQMYTSLFCSKRQQSNFYYCRAVQDTKFNLSYKLYVHLNMNTTDTQPPTCFGISRVASQGAFPYDGNQYVPQHVAYSSDKFNSTVNFPSRRLYRFSTAYLASSLLCEKDERAQPGKFQCSKCFSLRAT